MVEFVEGESNFVPVEVSIQKRDEVIEVEIADDHIVDALCLDARMGTGEFYLTHLFEHMQVFLI